MTEIANIEDQPSGFLLLNKDSGPTSFDMIYKLRRLTGIKKIGHAGTLDPFASGLLIIAIGRKATREINRFVKLDKKYVADLRLGAVTDTYDTEGQVKIKKDAVAPMLEDVQKTLNKFVGEQEQIPPMYSAKKVGGKKLYQLARKGQVIERTPEDINIFSISLVSYEWPSLILEIHCSSGTYIRSLAHDIGGALEVGAYLQKLKRTAIGSYSLNDAIDLVDLDEENWSTKLFVAS